MIKISWHQLELNSKSKELSFESFCSQIVRKKYSKFGKFESTYNSAGSEFYLELTKDCDELNLKIGDIIGWQAKFWLNNKDEDNSPLETKHRSELVEGFRKSITNKPNLKYWFICTPGKFINNKPDKPWNKLLNELRAINPNVEIGHWHKEVFESFRLSNVDEFNSIFNHYFNTKFIGIKLLNDFSRKNFKLLATKFDVDLYIQEEKEIHLFSSILLENGTAELKTIIKHLKNNVDDFINNKEIDYDNFVDLPSEYTNKSKIFISKHINLIHEIFAILNKISNPTDLAETIINCLNKFKNDIESERNELNNIFNDFYYEKKGQYNIKDRYWHESNIKFIKELMLKLFNKDYKTSLFNKCESILLCEYHVFGGAGSGKTNFTCSIVNELLNKDFPILFLLGSSFKSNLTPQERILQLLEIQKEYTFKEFLGALNNLGISKNIKIPIIIDGLNESSPSAGKVWNQEIDNILEDIKQFSNVMLITTCREKSEYIQQIFNKNFYQDIKNYIFLKGFNENNIEKAIERYFLKYNIKVKTSNYDKCLFYYPLRLKIFSEVNANKIDIEINIHSIVSSIDKYLDDISRKISKKNEVVDRIILNKLTNGLLSVGCLLWNKNSRELKIFDEFQPLFDVENVDWCDSLTFKIIDEGLCFQRELKDKDELIQFSIDLIGGYQIAKSVFFSKNENDETTNLLIDQNTKDKLFGSQSNFKHPISEDILIAISYLLPLKIGKQIHEIYNDSSIIIENISNLELLAFNLVEKQKLIDFIKNQKLDIETKSKIIQKIYSDAIQKEYFSLFDIIEDIFLTLNQYEIDSIWCELIRNDSYKIQTFLKKITQKLDFYKDNEYNIFLFISLLTASTDKLLRNEATKNLMYLGLERPDLLLKIISKFKNVNDISIIESIICSITGVVLRLKNKKITEDFAIFFSKDFLNNNATNHITILDFINTIFDFAFFRFDIYIDKKILFRNKNLKWKGISILKKKDTIEKYRNYEIMDYDFIKYQVKHISKNSYKSICKYSDDEIISMIKYKITENGYEKEKYNEIENKLIEDNKFTRDEVSERVISYAKKHLNIAYFELAGYLMVNNQIKSEFENSFRFNYIFYDPTFPKLLPKIQLINDCFLPSYKENIQDWINSECSELLKNIYITSPITQKKEMVLLFASFTQKNDTNNTRITLNLETHLFKKKSNKKQILKIIDSNEIYDSNEFGQLFGGEIPWRKDILFKENKYDKISNNELIPVIFEYNWSNWTSDRYQNPYFVFLNPFISDKMNLEFDINTLNYIDSNSEIVTNYYKTEFSEFIFIEKNILDKYLNENDCDLVWNKFIAKYGDFGKFKESTLEVNYKEFHYVDLYSKF